MAISEPRFAAARVDAAGQAAVYDDIGCLVLDAATASQDGWRWWVHDYETDAWVSADAAVFVRVPSLMTPMGSGLIAVADAEAADRLARVLGGARVPRAELSDVVAALPARTGPSDAASAIHGASP